MVSPDVVVPAAPGSTPPCPGSKNTTLCPLPFVGENVWHVPSGKADPGGAEVGLPATVGGFVATMSAGVAVPWPTTAASLSLSPNAPVQTSANTIAPARTPAPRMFFTFVRSPRYQCELTARRLLTSVGRTLPGVSDAPVRSGSGRPPRLRSWHARFRRRWLGGYGAASHSI